MLRHERGCRPLPPNAWDRRRDGARHIPRGGVGRGATAAAAARAVRGATALGGPCVHVRLCEQHGAHTAPRTRTLHGLLSAASPGSETLAPRTFVLPHHVAYVTFARCASVLEHGHALAMRGGRPHNRSHTSLVDRSTPLHAVTFRYLPLHLARGTRRAQRAATAGLSRRARGYKEVPTDLPPSLESVMFVRRPDAALYGRVREAVPLTVREEAMRVARLPEVLRTREPRPDPHGRWRGARAVALSPTDAAIAARVSKHEMRAPHWQLQASTPLSSNPIGRDNVEPPGWLWG